MPERIPVPDPDLFEQYRQTAQAVADIHHTLSIIVENAKELIPGEAVDDLIASWSQANASLTKLVESILPGQQDNNVRGTFRGQLERLQQVATAVAGDPPKTDLVLDLKGPGLLGETGKMKRSLLTRWKDTFLSFWYAEPRTAEKRKKAMEAGADLMGSAATVIGSIPGGGSVVEILSLTGRLLGIRARRET